MSLDILLSRNPIIHGLQAKSVCDYTRDYVEVATHLNIATGFVSNESIVALRRLVDYRKSQLHLSLFIGMNYMDGFTLLQYEAVKELGAYLERESIGNVYVSPLAMYHGKMYSFMQGSQCLGAFVGSSNLGSFIGTTQNYIETDLYFPDKLGCEINEKIVHLTKVLGHPVNHVKSPEKFKEEPLELLDCYEGVIKLSSAEKQQYLSRLSTDKVIIPLKTCKKSNLNAFFGAGKVRNRFSRRDYYEVELIINKTTNNLHLLPIGEKITIVTRDGYKFDCSRQGDCGKNFRSIGDLRILGRWIKGHMERQGALKLGELVTVDTIEKFGKKSLVLIASVDRDFWVLDIE